MKIRYTSQAANDLRSILAYISENGDEGAYHVKLALHRIVSLIGEFPQSGKLLDSDGTRALPAGKYPYFVFWTVENNSVWILHIRHTARKPWK